MKERVLMWRRTDLPGLERLVLQPGADHIVARSTVLSAEAGGLRVDHCCVLDPGWRALSVTVERRKPRSHDCLRLERDGDGWAVDGVRRPDLDGAAEPDLSVTPFCNTFAIRRMGPAAGERLELDTAFIDGAALSVTRSRQGYERQSDRRFRYVDLGLFRGFEAELLVDAADMVVSYEHLFERVAAAQ